MNRDRRKEKQMKERAKDGFSGSACHVCIMAGGWDHSSFPVNSLGMLLGSRWHSWVPGPPSHSPRHLCGLNTLGSMGFIYRNLLQGNNCN